MKTIITLTVAVGCVLSFSSCRKSSSSQEASEQSSSVNSKIQDRSMDGPSSGQPGYTHSRGSQAGDDFRGEARSELRVIDELASIDDYSGRKRFLEAVFAGFATPKGFNGKGLLELVEDLDGAGISEGTLPAAAGMRRAINECEDEDLQGLLNRLETSEWRKALASAIGEAMGRRADIPSDGLWAALAEEERRILFGGLVTSTKFESALELRVFLENVADVGFGGEGLVGSTFGLAVNIESHDLLKESERVRDDVIGRVLFRMGFSSLLQENPTEASRFLIDNEEEIGKIEFREAAGMLSVYLNSVDDPSAGHWNNRSEQD